MDIRKSYMIIYNLMCIKIKSLCCFPWFVSLHLPIIKLNIYICTEQVGIPVNSYFPKESEHWAVVETNRYNWCKQKKKLSISKPYQTSNVNLQGQAKVNLTCFTCCCSNNVLSWKVFHIELSSFALCHSTHPWNKSKPLTITMWIHCNIGFIP